MDWLRFSNPGGAYRAHRAPPTSVDWGSPYGSSPYITPDGRRVWMFRKGQKVRFYDAHGSQVGPQQNNVAPAAAFAYGMGWEDEEMLRRDIRPHAGDPTFKDFGKLAKNPMANNRPWFGEGEGRWSYGIKIDGIDNSFPLKPLGRQEEWFQVQAFQASARTDWIRAKHASSGTAALKRWVKAAKPSQFYAKWTEGDDSFKVWFV